MGGYYGSPATVLRNNKKLLGEKNKLTRKDYVGIKSKKNENQTTATADLKILYEIRTKMQIEKRKRRRKQLFLFLFSIFLTILALYLITKIKWIGIDLNRTIY
ncbi:hypothetical protein GOQ30_08145 [Flavobacterium sp. TP390]|uniref:Uncharacterized protein n=1 Tax=Flavobacterium profundi TaxID=1774945 RepID=A0A6I4IHJ8_9FLAO|nr:hypothetical protein [Flavobacterium profundi]MVO09130.1 hypothetical protein [Flavobacterium profundi]